ncbi:MAG: carbon starvation CstA family protein [Candidatus Hydrogenedentes bacterium]|nr:carbon starvation CstA family protein [Candidatus Hydrogenedentota bacterium]
MYLLVIIAISALCLVVAYRVYGNLLARLLELDSNAITPAVEMRDDVDYAPIEPKFLMSQHFSAIAAAGPIVGPILAGVMFGWLPALIWILIGSIFIGGVHDITALTASIRHKARSIAEVVRVHMSHRSYVLFLLFIWIALVYIIVAFTDIVAGSFVGRQELGNGLVVTGGGVATSSLMYLALPIVMGCLLRFTKLSLNMATIIFLPLVGVSIWIGQYLPFDLAQVLGTSDSGAQRIWGVVLLGYCFVASIVPVWMLLQPRGHLGGYFLYVALGGGLLGLALSGAKTEYPAYISWTAANGDPIAPILFITIACGACSGFHAIIASGTTSKQLRKETDAKVIGYGAMLLEAMVAVVSLCCVMILTREAAQGLQGKPNYIYAQGIGSFLGTIGIPRTFAISFGLLAFTTFVYDTLDVCTRLGRYIIQELTGWTGNAGRWIATTATAGAPLIFVVQTTTDATGKTIPAWRLFWNLFGASNQLLAALTLLGVTVWLWRTYRAQWVWWVAGIPTVFMYIMSTWALLRFARAGFFMPDWTFKGLLVGPVPWVALLLVGLAGLVLLEAVRVFSGSLRPPMPPRPEPAPAMGA